MCGYETECNHKLSRPNFIVAEMFCIRMLNVILPIFCMLSILLLYRICIIYTYKKYLSVLSKGKPKLPFILMNTITKIGLK